MAAPKGNKYSPGRPKGSKNRETLLREERRAIFENKISQKWEEIIDQLPATYVADQYLGKAPDKLDVTTKEEPINLTPELIEIAKQELKKRMKNDWE